MSARPIIVALLLLALPQRASAGGFFLFDRGTRATGRGNAFVAGADDPAALFYNPAGLVYSGRHLSMDASLPMLRASYTRIDGGGETLPEIDASHVPLPIPTLAYTEDFGLRRATFGLGIWAPNAVLLDWPDHVTVDDQDGPAPQRYSLLDMRGTLLTTIGLGAGVRLSKNFSLGLTAMLVTGSFGTRTTLSACDGVVCASPEDPDYDVVAQIEVPFFAAPTASIGLIGDFDVIRIGSSFDLPYTIRGDANLGVLLPPSPLFDGAYIEGQGSVDPDTGHRRATGSLRVPFPWIFRAGVEVRPTPKLRIETAFVMEGWSRQDSITLRTRETYIRDVVAIGDYEVGDNVIVRGMRNTYSVRLGAEIDVAPALVLRAGVQYETGAFPDAYLTALTIDSNKVIASIGGAVRIGEHFMLEGAFAYSVMRDVAVRDSAVPQLNPIRPVGNDPVYIGNGDYRMDAFLLSGGLRYQFHGPTRPVP